MLDIVIKNGLVVDGTGETSFVGDIGINGTAISKIGKIEEQGKEIINAKGMVVCPGFIDIHTHSDFTILLNPKAHNRVFQGVTTDVIGNCGESAAPITAKNRSGIKESLYFADALKWDWNTFDEYLSKLSELGISINIASLVGHGTLRSAVMGFDNRQPSSKELKQMEILLRDALNKGAFGLSTGLVYPPSSYATTDELVHLAKVLGSYGGIYASHIRGEGNNLIAAVKELLEIGEKAEAPVQFSHHKAAGKKNWGKVKETLQLIHRARDKGIDVTSDRYPYTTSSTGLTSLLPDWVHEGGISTLLKRLANSKVRSRIKKEINRVEGDWENPVRNVGWEGIVISQVRNVDNKWMEGRNIRDIAEERNMDEFSILFDLLIDEGTEVGIFSRSQCEEDVVRVLKDPTTMIGSDGQVLSNEGILATGKPHPRAYSTYPRVLGKYVREEKVLSLEEAIHKMTGMPAQKLGLKERGELKEGYAADLVVFDPLKVLDKADYKNPRQKPEGIAYVIVNGRITVQGGNHTGASSGKVLRK